MRTHDQRTERDLRIGEAAEYLHCSVETLRRRDRAGELVASRARSGVRVYKRSQLDAFAKGETERRDQVLTNDSTGRRHGSQEMSVFHDACRLAGRLTSGRIELYDGESVRLPIDLADRCYRLCVRRVRERLVPGILLEEVAPLVIETTGDFAMICYHNAMVLQQREEGYEVDEPDLPYPDQSADLPFSGG